MWKISGSLCKFIVCSRGKNRQLVWSELFLALKYLRELAECCLKGLWALCEVVRGRQSQASVQQPCDDMNIAVAEPPVGRGQRWSPHGQIHSHLGRPAFYFKHWERLIDWFFSLLFSFLIALKVLTMSMVIFYDVYNNM